MDLYSRPRSAVRVESDLEVISRIRKKRSEFERYQPTPMKNIYAFSDMMHSLEKPPLNHPKVPATEEKPPSDPSDAVAPADPPAPDATPRSRRSSSVVKHKDLCPKKEADTEADVRNFAKLPLYQNR